MWGDEGHYEAELKANICKRKVHSLGSCDQDQFEALILEQIQVVGGSKSLFNKIHRGMMKEGKLKEFNPFFIKEQCDLYQWRKDFIKDSENLCTCCDTFKEQYIVDIFEYAMATECLDLEEEDEITDYIRQQQEVPSCGKNGCGWCGKVIVDSSRDIQLMYDKDYMVGELEMAADDHFACEYDVLKTEQEEFIRENDKFQNYSVDDMGFNKLAHQIVEFNLKSPKTLLEQAIKAVKKFDIPTAGENLPATLEKKIESGLYLPGDEPPKIISKKGKDLFSKLNQAYLEVFGDRELVSLRSDHVVFKGLAEMYENLFHDDSGLKEFESFVLIYDNLFYDDDGEKEKEVETK